MQGNKPYFRKFEGLLQRSLSAFLSAENLAAKPYIPLPIFGIPGWHQDQHQVGFYEDKEVFRPPRNKNTR
ncbi:DUF3025 domain-containing protein [Oligella sp. MSHR50489EDL]|uniref:DUF3025 domain-containing protein n=1 Tax=Oligella sp. MSHR50489EDL TaxID=3139409 RepID=UPI003D812C75